MYCRGRQGGESNKLNVDHYILWKKSLKCGHGLHGVGFMLLSIHIPESAC